MGSDADRVEWIVSDVTTWKPGRRYDVWHDRAAFHFLTEEVDRAAYVARLDAALSDAGHAIIATFALDGPERCSGLPVRRYSPEALVETLEATTALAGARVLLPLADGARDVLPAELRRRGAIVDAVTAYQTVPVTRVGGEASSDLLNGVDMVTFASPSAVRGFHALINGGAVIPVAVIGPITASTARDLGYDVTVQAEEFTVVGLVEAILRHYMDERS